MIESARGARLAQRPPQVMAAAIILWISVSIGCTYALSMLTSTNMALIPVGIVLIFICVIWAILKRRNWARLLLLAVTLLGGGALAASLIKDPVTHASAMTYAVRCIQSVLRFTAVSLLFTNPARSWFRGPAS